MIYYNLQLPPIQGIVSLVITAFDVHSLHFYYGNSGIIAMEFIDSHTHWGPSVTMGTEVRLIGLK